MVKWWLNPWCFGTLGIFVNYWGGRLQLTTPQSETIFVFEVGLFPVNMNLNRWMARLNVKSTFKQAELVNTRMNRIGWCLHKLQHIPVSYSFIWSFAGWWKHVERQQPLDMWSAKLHPSGSWNLGVVLPEIGIFAWSTCRFGVVSALSRHVSTLSTPWYSKLDKFLEMISTRIFSSFLLESWKTTRLNLWILEL